jgi:hypothetical protein
MCLRVLSSFEVDIYSPDVSLEALTMVLWNGMPCVSGFWKQGYTGVYLTGLKCVLFSAQLLGKENVEYPMKFQI